MELLNMNKLYFLEIFSLIAAIMAAFFSLCSKKPLISGYFLFCEILLIITFFCQKQEFSLIFISPLFIILIIIVILICASNYIELCLYYPIKKFSKLAVLISLILFYLFFININI